MENRLESIELQGIKTFAITTRLEFPGKITAIVGPNGSGKSNIADAIRWVLGEQSFSLLRAKKTEDMIFSGSQQRSRAGMASATITFNNEEGWLPIDYSHVSITRQAYRDGQNEYILNGQKVRLKDISELLSQTGLAERNYTIIGQGLVDAALALKPDERRKLFEEAAGIGLYRSRKEEAQRRLENTRKNLDRVLDILNEINPRLRSLERQAERFQEYQQVKDDLQLLLREWYGYQWHEKQKDLLKIRQSFLEQETNLNRLRNKRFEAEKNVEEARTKLQLYRKELEEFHGELSENHSLLERNTRELAIIEERQRSYEVQKDNLELDLSNVEEEIKGLVTHESTLQVEIDQRQSEFDIGKKEEKTSAQELETILKRKAGIDTDLEGIKTRRIQLETEKIQVTVRIEQLENRINALKDEHAKVRNALQAFDDDIKTTRENSISAEVSFNKASRDLEEKQLETNKLVKRLNELEEENTKIKQQLDFKENQITKTTTQLTLLNDAEKALSGYSEGSKKLIEISRQGLLPQGLEPLSQFLVIEEKYERAISAALGELTDLLVMPLHIKTKLIEYLEAKESDRVALAPNDLSYQHIDLKKIPDGDNIVGFANELISVDKTHKILVDILLSHVLLVKDVRTAVKLSNHLKEPITIVTLSGIVFQPNGVIISGPSPAGKRIGRTRQQIELKNDLSLIENEMQELILEKAKLDSSIMALKDEHVKATEEISLLDQEKQEKGRVLQDVKEALMRLGNQKDWYLKRSKEIDASIFEIQSSIETESKRLKELDDQIGVLLTDEQKCNQDLKTLPLFEVQQNLNQIKTRQLIVQNALEAMRQRFLDNSNQIGAAKLRWQKLKERLEEAGNNLIEIDNQKNQLKTNIVIIQQKNANLENEYVQPLSAVGEELEKSVLMLEKNETDFHQEVINAERQQTQLQLELSRRQDQLDLLRERINNDFGLVIYESGQKFDIAAPLPFNDELIEDLPQISEISENHEDEIKRLKNQLRRIGAVNPEAQEEYIEVKERFEFLNNQVEDLDKASKDLQEVIEELDRMMEVEFIKTFQTVNKEFSNYFSRLFNGGEAKLVFADDENPVEGGVDIEARLPGRRQQGLALFSGGERSLTAVALIFALLKVSPPPFCILDEVDAMLDESNVGRFVEELRELAKHVQVVIITHNRNTVQAADVIYGVTMGRDSTSQMISLKLEEVGEAYLE